MTAIGIVLLVVGKFLVDAFGVHPVTYHFSRRLNNWDYIGITCYFVGVALALIGVVEFIWQVLP
jgi:hypothetical protein